MNKPNFITDAKGDVNYYFQLLKNWYRTNGNVQPPLTWTDPEYDPFPLNGLGNTKQKVWVELQTDYAVRNGTTFSTSATPTKGGLFQGIKDKWDGFTKKIEAVKDKAGNLKYQTLQPFRFAMVGYLNRKGVKASYSDPIQKTAESFYTLLKVKPGVEGPYKNPIDGSNNPVSPTQIQQIVVEIMQFFSDIATKAKNGGRLSTEEDELKKDAERGENMPDKDKNGGDWSGTLKIVVGIAVLIAALKIFKVF